jgi:polyvinyl alcohol dehydrogenase (cytochrome)
MQNPAARVCSRRSWTALLAAAGLVGGISLSAGAQAPPDGAAIFARDCASCHDGAADSRAPRPEILRQRSPEAILSALTAGGMRPQGGRLSGLERRAVAEYLSGRPLGSDVTGAAVGRCSAAALSREPAPTPFLWAGWSPAPTNTRFQSAKEAGLTAENVPRLTLKWAFGFPDATSAWSQPTVSGGRLFVGSQNGTVYALDPKTGCVHWTFTAKSGVRTAVVAGSAANGRGLVFFGDTGANVYALEAESGKQIWSRRADEHPYARVTGTPTAFGGRLYVPVSSLEETAASQAGYECCTFRGSLIVLDISTGAVVWQYFTVPPAQAIAKTTTGATLWGPAGVGIWSSPTIDAKRSLVYVGTGNTYSGTAQPTADSIIALDLKSGEVKWMKQFTAGDVFGCRAGTANCGARAGPDADFGTPPMLATLADNRDILVVGQKSGMTYGLDPDKEGAVLWEYRAGQGSIWGGVQWGAAVDRELAYFPVSDIRTPAPGGLHAVRLATGERAWYQPPPPLACAAGATCNAALISAPSLIPGVLFSGSNDGMLRAHSTKDGSVLWSFDTNREFMTLNGITAGGGSIQGPGPTIAGGMLYLNSGYGDHLGRPGNVLLAFEVQ